MSEPKPIAESLESIASSLEDGLNLLEVFLGEALVKAAHELQLIKLEAARQFAQEQRLERELKV